MTETTQPAGLPATGSRGQPLKISQYVAEGARLTAAVNAYRAAKGAASAEEPLTQSSAALEPVCNKPKSYKLPPLDRPSEIEGYPLNPTPAQEVPDYGSIARVKAARATKAARRGKRAPLTPSGPSRLVKRRV